MGESALVPLHRIGPGKLQKDNHDLATLEALPTQRPWRSACSNSERSSGAGTKPQHAPPSHPIRSPPLVLEIAE
jgi:hypothetical protein